MKYALALLLFAASTAFASDNVEDIIAERLGRQLVGISNFQGDYKRGLTEFFSMSKTCYGVSVRNPDGVFVFSLRAFGDRTREVTYKHGTNADVGARIHKRTDNRLVVESAFGVLEIKNKGDRREVKVSEILDSGAHVKMTCEF